MNKLQSLTVLRGVAAVTVIFYHIMAPTGHTLGEFGVDIFFVLSGFVIALVLDSPRLTAQRFLSDRIARIVPLYWVLTFVVLAGTLIAPSLFNSTTADLGNLLKSLFFIPYRKESGLIFPMLFVGWTLNYEMMFYVVAAISLALTRRHRLLFASALIFVIFCAASASGSRDAFAEFYSYQRVFEFPLGFVVYRLWKRGVRIRPALAVGIAIAAYVWMAYVNWNELSRAHLLYFGVPAFLLVVSSLSLESKIGSGPLTKGALFIGDASYAIYLSHPYCVEAVRKLLTIDGFDATSPVGVAVIIVIATAVGAALYWFVDRPLHSRARRLLQSLPPVRLPGSRLAGLKHEIIAADDRSTRNVQVNHDAR
ncbi:MULTISPECIES: acyltransferase family protein [Paraburkholderia]|jgi:peptidoglycan/LPS O-acetylase OafA/YrhL|uniref:Exopolysaccharide production protein ExoZ n=1 Tax=Paraburkholderia largidicola TaxID=3014751 RepID=A0A7I8BK51_9BURK|nr:MULTISPECIES: acyltransferase [Paraburkholderia]BCF88813.1 exopolysaccharide production protein ExoZ [Paraburkholderia sp. PGU16]GJH31324.1 acyltransferase family protein [Paraburkholderia hospita]CAG9255534.1 Peptidoglycan/LPS O-acetylase OafA/YrhL, contains acyltransferase and SGNH-hydrolase domains [Paraburkholderia caribensis]